MKKKYVLRNLMFLIGFLFCGISYAQSISGTVSDATGSLPGANVVVKGTTNGVITDFDGGYTLNDVPSNAELIISFVGFQTQTINVDGKSTINVVLEEEANQLDEVVVVGYGTQSRAAVTGAVTTVSSDVIMEVPVTRADQALQGRAAGVTVVNNGSPGSPPQITIRGLTTTNDNSPLVVIDGIVGGSLADINPNDIESFTVLKDASTAAIYGALGANGVIMVTTKKGKSGVLKLNFDTFAGVQTQTERYNLLNTAEYVQYATEFGQLQNPVAIPVRITDPQYASYLQTDTDWQDELFQNGIMQSYNLSAQGGGEHSNYLVSVGYFDQEGIVRNTDYSRLNFRANSESRFGKFTFGETFSVSFNNQVGYDDGSGRSPLEHTIKMAPYFNVYNPNNRGGFQGPTSGLDNQDAENPIRRLELGNRDNSSENLLGNVYASYEIIDGLTIKTQGGINYTNGRYDGFTPSFIDNENDGGGQHQQLWAAITKNTSKFESYIWTNSLDYAKTYNDVHNFQLLLVAEMQKNKYSQINANSQNAVTDEIENLSIEGVGLSSFSSEYARQGYLARLNYDYDNKYIFAASIRYDGSSRFGSENRWGYFPSVALGWNIAKEDFLMNSSMNNFKLRGSWGITGNDRIGDYRYSSVLTSNYNYPFGSGEDLGVGTTAAGPADPALKWEEVTMLNIGVDLGFWNDKLRITAEYFDNQSDDLLLNEPLPPSLINNNNSVATNVGSVKTNGFELTVGYSEYSGEFTWGVDVNITSSNNEVLDLGSSGSLFGGTFENQPTTRSIVGEEMFHFYGYETDGIFQTQAEVDAHASQPNAAPGDFRMKDVNGDGQITGDDRTIIGSPFPDFTYGINANAAYKNFDFNMFWYGSQGNELYNTNIYDLQGMTRLFNSGADVKNRWTGPGTSNTIPRAYGAPSNVDVSDRFVEDGSFLRLKNIAIGYSIPLVNKNISKLRVYFSGQNLVTFTDYSGLDPEVGLYRPSVDQTNLGENGIDRGNYPTPRTYTFGIQMSF